MAFKHGNYTPKHTEKCINMTRYNKLPYYRSGWEARVFWWMDNNVKVVRWGSELKETVVEYQLPMPNGKSEFHRYIPDVYAEIREKSGEIKRYLIEVKPDKDGNKPIMPKRKTQKSMMRYNNGMMVYIKNRAKWQYAKRWCSKRGIVFKIFTEQTIFNKRK